ncbi:hypothetical protein GGR56DRAFT_686791 [Xylariaceae sp. FL0804]|nr:hypothetical protein GGR56DRAFT_686791 [Xylariaceae sp. FL0804]
MLTHHQLAGAIVVLIAALGFEAVRHSFESQPLSAVVKLEPRIVVPPLQLTTTDQQHGTHDCGQLGDLVPLTRCDELLGLLSTCGAHEALARAAEEPPATAAAAAVAAAFDQSRQQQGQKVKLKQTQKPKLDVLSPATSLYDVFGASPADEDILPLVQRGVLAYGRETAVVVASSRSATAAAAGDEAVQRARRREAAAKRAAAVLLDASHRAVYDAWLLPAVASAREWEREWERQKASEKQRKKQQQQQQKKWQWGGEKVAEGEEEDEEEDEDHSGRWGGENERESKSSHGDIWDEYDHHRGLDRRLVCAAARAALDECVPECADA